VEFSSPERNTETTCKLSTKLKRPFELRSNVLGLGFKARRKDEHPCLLVSIT
jgi:hypothetical protein